MSAGRPPRSSTNRWGQPLKLVLRLLVLGVGLGVITGTSLKLLAPRLADGAIQKPLADAEVAGNGAKGLPLGSFEPRQELTALSQKWSQLAAVHKDLKVSGFLLVLDDGRFGQLQPDLPLPAASSIKTPILLVGLEDFDHGKVRWNDPLPLTKEVVGGGAGWMASRPVGSRFPFYEAATEMIRVSDNSATNLLIKRVGGKTMINARFQQLGLPATVVNNWLPDLNGTNTTSSRDLAKAIALVDTGQKLSPRARDLFREVMGKSLTNTLIPLGLLQGLGKDAADPDSELLSFGITVYNKTGDIGIAYADAALIQLPTGQRAVAAFMVKGPFNDPRSTDLIRAMAGAAAQTLVGRR
ncbi:serine hydrolase [Synechococcus sp. CS-1328]|uniref:serine hydrolase n=1 Tax=Synechococcus sp. CS-1328 TaxID=2847976 RepID=UPI00223BB778|nr:serine hydrolase [Synechococcus sp. CS-1328]MCT0225095.1 class A beta-lactamase-related serine hydrolase [Synechococcus sp. CS-1328]